MGNVLHSTAPSPRAIRRTAIGQVSKLDPVLTPVKK
jgi:hypothetical protein